MTMYRKIVISALVLALPTATMAQDIIRTPYNGNTVNAQVTLCTNCSAGGGGGGGDASAANQNLQLTQEQLTNARLGDTTSPSGGSVNARLGAILAALGTPLQTNGTIAGITNPVSVTGAFWQATQPISAAALPLPSGASTSSRQDTIISTLGTLLPAGGSISNITGTVSLPTGAATLTAQTTGNGYLASLAGNDTPDTVALASTPLAAAGQTATLVLDGSSNAIWNIASSDFVGTVVSEGCIEATCTSPGGRLLFKAGVGSIGTTSIVLTGGTVAREYRVVGGGNRVRLRVTAYTSGTLTVRGYAQRDTNMVFVNGPVHNGEEEALRAGRAFIVSSQIQAVPANSNLIATISNPAGSGVNAFVTMRLFECNQATATTPAEWITYAAPTTVPTTAVTPSNRMVGGAAPQTQFRYQVTTSATMGGTQADAGTLVTGGGPTPNMIMTTLVPGQTGGVLIGGGGGGLAAAQRCKVSYSFYEESTQ